MSASVDDPVSLEALAVELAESAAVLVRDASGERHEIGSKSTATDLVTEADQGVERWLIAELGRRRPDDAVLGEEGGDHPGRDRSAGRDARTGARVRWVIDPIDGTVNFVLGIPQFAISVAAEVDGEVVAGAVTNPLTGETFHARRGGGAHLSTAAGTRSLTGPRDVPLERAVVGTGFAYDAAMRARQIDVVGPLLPRLADIRRLGAAALDLCFVAAGRLDGYFEAGLHRWDYAAGGLVAAEAGCVLSGLHGRPPSGRLLAVAGPALAPDLFALLEELGADRVAS